jgi:hypothetical protein
MSNEVCDVCCQVQLKGGVAKCTCGQGRVWPTVVLVQIVTVKQVSNAELEWLRGHAREHSLLGHQAKQLPCNRIPFVVPAISAFSPCPLFQLEKVFGLWFKKFP